jgi:hypothetical protein
MPESRLNPFFYPGPVPPSRFVGRQEELQSIISRIATGQNTSVVGVPNIGKSSLLRCLAENQTSHAQLGSKAANTIFVFQDCHLLPGSFTPSGFWRQILAYVWTSCPDDEVRQAVNWAGSKHEFGSYALERVFKVVTKRGWSIALLVDEFDTLLPHAGFNTAEFFGALRSLATRFSGLALVTATRLSVAAMNRHSGDLNPYGSPFFNGFIEVNLRPFEDDDVEELLSKALAGTGVTFNAPDRDFLHAMAGGHPFLLQAAAGALYNAITSPESPATNRKNGRLRYYQAAHTFYKQTEDHFSDLWRHLDPRARTAATILCLGEIQGRLPGQRFDTSEIGSLDRYEAELSRLAEQGLVERWSKDGWHADWNNWVVWHGERWRVTSRRLVWWVSDQVLARDEVDWEEWLDAKRYQGLLTVEEVETLKKWAKKIPKATLRTVAEIIGVLLGELLDAAL